MAWPSNPIDQGLPPADGDREALERSTFSGAAGLRQLNGPLEVTSPVPAEFRATLHRARFGPVALEYFEATAHAVSRGPDQIAAHPQALLMVVFVLDGDLHVQTGDRRSTAGRGDALLMDTRIAATSHAAVPIRLLRSIIDPELLPPARRDVRAAPLGPLPRTPLVESYRAFVSAVLRTTPTLPPTSDSHLPAALLQLHDAVLTEARHIALQADGPAGLRARITLLIDQEHTDSGLDVAAIARALGVSVRQVHAAYNRGDRTVGRSLTERRAETAGHLLRAAVGPVHFTDIARSAGFTSRERLNRAFHDRYGCSPDDYRRQHV